MCGMEGKRLWAIEERVWFVGRGDIGMSNAK